jgi:hypothetical protein
MGASWSRLGCFLVLGAASCGGAPPPVGDRSGEYHGPNRLSFALTAPVQRQMPPESHRGSAVVTDARGSDVTLELRMFEGGETCRIQARRAADATEPDAEEQLQVAAGQRCASRFGYDGTPVAAVVEIQEGTVVFRPGAVRVELSGRFVADMAGEDGTNESEGIARWEFDGTR